MHPTRPKWLHFHVSPVGRFVNSDWFINSFIMVARENFFFQLSHNLVSKGYLQISQNRKIILQGDAVFRKKIGQLVGWCSL